MTKPKQTEPLQLTVSNFGPIAKAEIDLRPLTVFVGPSNTGKSYLAILIYALHRFFDDYAGSWHSSFRGPPSILHKSITAQQPFDDKSIRKLADWIRDLSGQVDAESPSDSPPLQLPDFVASMVRPLFNDLGNFIPDIVTEIERSFGIEDPARLIRHGNREGAKIALHFKPFEYELALKKGKPKGSVISISEEIPLYINLHSERMKYFLLRGIDNLNILMSAGDGSVRQEARQYVEYLIRELYSLTLPNVISPLNNSAYYLPADRTGVMHAHRVVVASLIERAPRAGLRRDSPLPALSGVLADFLEQLVKLGEPRIRRNNKGNLAADLEQQILSGEVQRKDSETGYPMFSYQPQGWKEDLPMMNASSMVSELAPVVLYLRHIVQRGDVLIIEEPESHLHPAMQVEFIRQLAAVVHSGIRVMLTTHSEWVLDELANLVRLSDLPKARRRGIAGADFALNRDQVGVWLFEPKQRPRGSVVKEIPFDAEFGGFRSGFDDVAIGTYNDHAEISNRVEGSK